MIPKARRALWLLIAISGGLRLIWAAALSFGNDEAYHYLFAMHPDWSYFDHPPMTMLVERIGLTLFGGVSELSLRLGFVLLFAGSTWIMFRWTSRWYGEWAGFYAALALNLTAYYTAAAGALVLPDGPLLFFSLLTLWGLSEALVPRERNGRAEPREGPDGTHYPAPHGARLAHCLPVWVWVGLAWGGALLSKYHAIFLPAGAFLYILITPSARRCLLTPGPYLAAVIGMGGFLPVLVWNVQNDWASFTFQASRAVGWEFRPDALFTAIGGQALYLFPWIWVGLLLVLFRFLRLGNALGGVERLLMCLAMVPLTFFLAVSCVQMILPHWTLIGFLPLYPALGAFWAAGMAVAPVQTRRWLTSFGITTVCIAGAFAVQACFGILPMERDPTVEMSDWTPIARELEKRGLVDKPGSFLFTRCWFESGHLSFALRNRVPVLCYDTDARGFAYWSRPEEWVGKDGYLVAHGNISCELQMYADYFRRIEKIAEFPATRNGQPIREMSVYRCVEQMKPFPFRPLTRHDTSRVADSSNRSGQTHD